MRISVITMEYVTKQDNVNAILIMTIISIVENVPLVISYILPVCVSKYKKEGRKKKKGRSREGERIKKNEKEGTRARRERDKERKGRGR